MKRSGLCSVGSERHVKCNNISIPGYDENVESDSLLLYIDANNLYGWAMSQLLPTGNLEFRDDVSIDQILKTSDDNPTGYI